MYLGICWTTYNTTDYDKHRIYFDGIQLSSCNKALVEPFQSDDTNLSKVM